jgi:hypothetical protein
MKGRMDMMEVRALWPGDESVLGDVAPDVFDHESRALRVAMIWLVPDP